MKKTLFFVAAVTISSCVSAQLKIDSATSQTDASFNNSPNLDPVVVTATKYPMKTSKTGKVITVITREQIEQSGGKDLSQLLTEQTGLYINGANSNPGKDKSVYLRGARVDHTLITIDGVPVYDASGIGGNFDIRNLALANIERIEILKGSQSTLYGSDAIAGVINIITRKAGSKKIAGDARISYGSFNTLQGNASLNGRSGKLDYTAGYNLQTTKGLNEASSNAVNADKDGYNQHSLFAGLGIQATEKIRIQPYLRYTSINGDLDQGAFTDELDYTYTQKSWQAGVRNEFSFGKSKLNVLYNYNSINRNYTDDSTKSRNGFDTWSEGRYKGGEHFADAYAFLPISRVIQLTAGADYRSSTSDQTYNSIGFFGPSKSEYGKDSLRQNQLGLYASLNITNNKGFNLEAGNRVNIHSEYGSAYVYNFNPSYLIRNRVKVFANLSSAYRTPSLYQLFSEYGNRNLKPESAQTVEGGVQVYAEKPELNVRAVYFRRKVKDVIFFFFNRTTFQSQYINQDKQNDHGLELELNAVLANKINIRAFYTYVTGEISTKTGTGKDTTYFNLLRRPENSFGLNISSQVTKKLFLSANLSAFGKRKDAYFDSNTFSTVYVDLKSYALLHLYGEYGISNNKLKVFADLRNVTDTKYTEVSGFNATGFAVYGGVRVSL